MAAATGVLIAQDGNQQFQGVFNRVKTVTATLDSASVANGANTTDTVAVPGVVLGDMVLALSTGVSLAGVARTAYVSAANVVTISTANTTGGAVDLASTTIKLVVASPAF
jgi:hypothetical protein